MESEWPKLRLDEVTELIVDCPHSTPKWTETGVIVLRSQYIKKGQLNLSGSSFTTEEDYQARTKRAVPSAGDIVLTREAPMGEVCMVPANIKCCLGQRMVLLRVNKNILDSEYLLYTLQSPFLQHQISWNEGTGTTVSNIRIPSIKAFEIPTPELLVQKRVARILSTLDNKIQLNRQTNQTLEQMAQALFKSWFVDFDPVIDNALAAGNAIPESLLPRADIRKQQLAKPNHKPLSKALLDLFPSEFEETELSTSGANAVGWVPKGWGVGTLSEITTELRRGISPKYIEEGGVQVVNQKCIRNHEINYRLCRRNNTELKKIAGRELFVGDVLINSTGVGTLGRIAQVHYLPENTVVDSHVTLVRPDQIIYPKYVFGQMMLAMENYIESLGEGSTGQTELSRKMVSEQIVIIPNQECLKLANKQIQALAEKSVVNSKQNETLEKLRDTLLPKLISGELRLSPETLAETKQPLKELA